MAVWRHTDSQTERGSEETGYRQQTGTPCTAMYTYLEYILYSPDVEPLSEKIERKKPEK